MEEARANPVRCSKGGSESDGAGPSVPAGPRAWAGSGPLGVPSYGLVLDPAEKIFEEVCAAAT